MCRLLGIVPGSDSIVDFSVVRSFRNLASCGKVCEGSGPGHGDGWGMVAWENGSPTYLGREPSDAFTDPLYENACIRGESSKISSHLITHLRKASVGLKVRENTHPFTQGEWAFAHNGTIRKLNLKYTTDSQWFFESIMQENKKNGGDIISAISKNVRTVREIYPYTSITFLLSNGRTIYGYRDATANIEYYTLFYAKTSGGLYVTQETFFDAPWTEVDNGSLLVVNPDLTTEVIPILPEITAANSA
jgi:predicted glutamine amidotransferase